MTRAEALAEARRRWDSWAFAEERHFPGALSPFTHFVGGGGIFTPKTEGSGGSWEAAFANAAARAGGRRG